MLKPAWKKLGLLIVLFIAIDRTGYARTVFFFQIAPAVRKTAQTSSHQQDIGSYITAANRYLGEDTTRGHVDRALFEVDKALVTGIKGLTGDQRDRILALSTRAEILAANDCDYGKIDEAWPVAKHLLAIYQKLGYKKKQNAYDILAQISKWNGNLDQKLFYGLEALKSMAATNDTSEADRFNYEVGCTYAQLNMYDKSRPYLIKALDAAREGRHADGYHTILEALSPCLRFVIGPEKTLSHLKKWMADFPPQSLFAKKFDQLTLADAYKALKRPADAEGHYLQMIRFSELLNKQKKEPVTYLIIDYGMIAEFYINNSQFKKAAFYLVKVKGFPGVRVDPRTQSMLYLTKFKTDSASGEYFSAIRHYQSYKQLQDSLFNVEKVKQIAEIQGKYEVDQKDKDIQLKSKDIQLLKKQSLLQENKVFRARTIIVVNMIGFFFVVGIGVYRYRLKLESNKQLMVKQEEIVKKNSTLERLLKENELLLKEVHHRVKNNLQTVMGLLKTQSVYLKDEAAFSAVMESRHRIHAMSLIHQKLYKSDQVRSVYMPAYINELVEYLKDSFRTGMNIYFKIDIIAVNFDLATAIPVGLILNEVITNAIKYAFLFPCEGIIEITMELSEREEIVLSITDNGRGIPADFDLENGQSFGLSLVKGLAEDLGGTCEINSHEGTAVKISFSYSTTNNEDFAHIS